MPRRSCSDRLAAERSCLNFSLTVLQTNCKVWRCLPGSLPKKSASPPAGAQLLLDPGTHHKTLQEPLSTTHFPLFSHLGTLLSPSHSQEWWPSCKLWLCAPPPSSAPRGRLFAPPIAPSAPWCAQNRSRPILWRSQRPCPRRAPQLLLPPLPRPLASEVSPMEHLEADVWAARTRARVSTSR